MIVYELFTISIPADKMVDPGSVPIHLMTPYHGAESGRSTWIMSSTSNLGLFALETTLESWSDNSQVSEPAVALEDNSSEHSVLVVAPVGENTVSSHSDVLCSLLSTGLDALDENLLSRCWRMKSLWLGEPLVGSVVGAVLALTGLSVWASSLAWIGNLTPAASELARCAEPVKWEVNQCACWSISNNNIAIGITA